MKLSELPQMVFHHRYDKDVINKGNPRTGWSYILTVQNLSRILPSPLPKTADKLLTIWSDNWEERENKDNKVTLVLNEIDEIRSETLQLLTSFE